MIRQIAPQFFTQDIPGTLAYYEAKLGFKCLGKWQDPPVYAIVARDDGRRYTFAVPNLPQPIPTSIRTNCSTRTYSSKMRTRFTLSMQLSAWNSREDLLTCHGTRVSLW
jgi:hypothetical protein